MSVLHSLSHRVVERSSVLRPIHEHKFRFNKDLLATMFNSATTLIEIGGIYGLAYSIRSDLKDGLHEDEAPSNFEVRREIYGANFYPLPTLHSKKEYTWAVLKHPANLSLVFIALCSITVGSLENNTHGRIGGILMLIVLFFSFYWQGSMLYDIEKTHIVRAATQQHAPVSVVRAGRFITIPHCDILVGDLVILQPGSVSPGDGILVDRTTLRIRTFDGTRTLLRDWTEPLLRSGDEVLSGSGAMLVTAVGQYTLRGMRDGGIRLI